MILSRTLEYTLKQDEENTRTEGPFATYKQAECELKSLIELTEFARTVKSARIISKPLSIY